MHDLPYHPGSVVLEGLPGVGKTTIATMLASLIGASLVPELVVHLRANSREEHERHIRNDWLKGQRLLATSGIVIMDRYYMSTRVVNMVLGLDEQSVVGLPRPQLWCVLTAPLALIQRRWQERGRAPSPMWLAGENLAGLERAYARYSALGVFDQRPCLTLSADAPREILVDFVVQALKATTVEPIVAD